MDIKVTQTEVCKCKRAVIGVSGRCDICIREGARMFWAFMDGTFGQFMTEIVK
jgi:hypothetical protein